MTLELDAKDMYFYREKCRQLEEKERLMLKKIADYEEVLRHYADVRNHVRVKIETATELAIGVLKKWGIKIGA